MPSRDLVEGPWDKAAAILIVGGATSTPVGREWPLDGCTWILERYWTAEAQRLSCGKAVKFEGLIKTLKSRKVDTDDIALPPQCDLASVCDAPGVRKWLAESSGKAEMVNKAAEAQTN